MFYDLSIFDFEHKKIADKISLICYRNVFCFDYDGQKFMFKFITENRREPEFLFMTFKRNEWIKIHLDILEDEIKQIDPLLTKEQNIVAMKDKVYEAIEFFFMD